MLDHERMAIHFPCLIAQGWPKAYLIAVKKSDFARFDYKGTLNNNRYLLKNGSTPGVRIQWILDKDANFREVTQLKVRRTLFRGMAWLWDFTLVECEIDSGAQLTVRELLLRCDKLTSPPGFPRAGHLKGFLRKSDPNANFDEVMFREFWDRHCPKLSEEEWQKTL